MCKSCTHATWIVKPTGCLIGPIISNGKVASDQGVNVTPSKTSLKKCRNKNRYEDGTLKAHNSLEVTSKTSDQGEEMTLLQLFALNALDLTTPAANELVIINRMNEWVQLSGHEGAFSPAGYGTIWKRRFASDDTEVKAYRALMMDHTRDFVPQFYKEVEYKEDFYIEMQDLLQGFKDPFVMDIKMGTRTFGEQEVKNQTPRPDLYQKMIAVDPNAATEDENAVGAITKLRYMEFREQLSSTSTFGFRIEAVKYGQTPPITNHKFVKSKDQILETMSRFLSGRETTKTQITNRLRSMRKAIEQSSFFRTHEIIGSSILIVYDQFKAGAWMIDFAKTLKLSDGQQVDHLSPWQIGNHEDGYLRGLDNLIEVLENIPTLKS